MGVLLILSLFRGRFVEMRYRERVDVTITLSRVLMFAVGMRNRTIVA